MSFATMPSMPTNDCEHSTSNARNHLLACMALWQKTCIICRGMNLAKIEESIVSRRESFMTNTGFT